MPLSLNPVYSLDTLSVQANTSLTRVLDKEMQVKTVSCSVDQKQEQCRCWGGGGDGGDIGDVKKSAFQQNRYNFPYLILV